MKNRLGYKLRKINKLVESTKGATEEQQVRILSRAKSISNSLPHKDYVEKVVAEKDSETRGKDDNS